jgi:hypothetical protein
MMTVGLFAGRGDVVLAMILALMVGAWIGWKTRGAWEGIKRKPAPAKP